jgi:hypothetical protein
LVRWVFRDSRLVKRGKTIVVGGVPLRVDHRIILGLDVGAVGEDRMKEVAGVWTLLDVVAGIEAGVDGIGVDGVGEEVLLRLNSN